MEFIHDQGEDRTTPFELAAASELKRHIEMALASLPLRYREVLLLVAVERLDPIDAAQILNINSDTLRQRLHRGRDMIARKLQLMGSIPSELREEY
jgi:RNA polymerase sigma-70 factor (ECF subfamily)